MSNIQCIRPEMDMDNKIIGYVLEDLNTGKRMIATVKSVFEQLVLGERINGLYIDSITGRLVFDIRNDNREFALNNGTVARRDGVKLMVSTLRYFNKEDTKGRSCTFEVYQVGSSATVNIHNSILNRYYNKEYTWFSTEDVRRHHDKYCILGGFVKEGELKFICKQVLFRSVKAIYLNMFELIGNLKYYGELYGASEVTWHTNEVVAISTFSDEWVIRGNDLFNMWLKYEQMHFHKEKADRLLTGSIDIFAPDKHGKTRVCRLDNGIAYIPEMADVATDERMKFFDLQKRDYHDCYTKENITIDFRGVSKISRQSFENIKSNHIIVHRARGTRALMLSIYTINKDHKLNVDIRNLKKEERADFINIMVEVLGHNKFSFDSVAIAVNPGEKDIYSKFIQAHERYEFDGAYKINGDIIIKSIIEL